MPYLYREDTPAITKHFKKLGRESYEYTALYSRYDRRRIAVSTALICPEWKELVKGNVEKRTSLNTWAGYVIRGDNANYRNVSLELHGKYALNNFHELRERLIERAREIDAEGFSIQDPSENMDLRFFSITHKEIQNNVEWEDRAEIMRDSFDFMINTFDFIFKEYEDNKAHLIKELIKPKKNVVANSLFDVSKLDFHTWHIKDIPFNTLQIPFYQRSYRWGIKQVNQLINDVIEFIDISNSAPGMSYRLGSLVLNKHDIVDGQQRLVTISLLLYSMWNNKKIRNQVEDDDVKVFMADLVDFWNRVSYKDQVAFANISRNLELIKERETELSPRFFKTLLEKCQFVVIILPTSSEAFQFFDSQNARGKDLEAHDLLKAFHLRDIPEDGFSEERDGKNIDIWQKEDTEKMKELFLTLFRIKQWSAGNTAQFFRKSDIGAFKGLSLINYEKDPRFRLPCYDSAYLLAYLYELFVKQPELQNDKCPSKYPFQIDGTVINGSQFFDMIIHYLDLYKTFTDKERNLGWFESHLAGDEQKLATDIIRAVNNYPTCERVGDSYVSELFYALILYYYDKFGTEKLGTAISKFFVYAYSIRLTSSSVYRASVDKKAYTEEFFKTIKNANTPFDVLNIYVPSLTESQARTRNIPELFKVFNELKKIR